MCFIIDIFYRKLVLIAHTKSPQGQTKQGVVLDSLLLHEQGECVNDGMRMMGSIRRDGRNGTERIDG